MADIIIVITTQIQFLPHAELFWELLPVKETMAVKTSWGKDSYYKSVLYF